MAKTKHLVSIAGAAGLVLVAAAALIGALNPSAAAVAGAVSTPFAKGDFIRVAPDNFTFADAAGRRFVPMGAYYFDDRHPDVNAMDYWDYFKAADIERDFALARQLGCNTLRLTFHLTPVGADSRDLQAGTPEDFNKCDELVAAARRNGLRLYVNISLRGRHRQDPRATSLYAEGFRRLAERYRDEPAIFCWEVDSEATTLVGHEGDRAEWERWLASRYPSEAANAAAWGLKPTPGWRDKVWEELCGALYHNGEFDKVRNAKPTLWYLDSLNKKNDRKLYDWQLFREHLYTVKITPLVKAVRAADPNHLVAIDLILWEFPLVRNQGAAGWGGPYGYSALDLAALGKMVDFIGVHTYPFYIPPFTSEWYENLSRDPKILDRELRYLETLCRYVRANSGRPVVRSETGWHGGAGDYSRNTEADQARWCEDLTAATNDCAVGWINWTLRDVPTHEKLTQYSGLVTAGITVKLDAEDINPLSKWLWGGGDLPEGQACRLKAWGKAFGPLAARCQSDPAIRFVPGKRIELSRRLLYTADNRTLDALLQDCMSDKNFPCDIHLVE
ncbi:MAG: beta-galactosidase [bacterium]|nr:beta-galactosidase [bacterium]